MGELSLSPDGWVYHQIYTFYNDSPELIYLSDNIIDVN